MYFFVFFFFISFNSVDAKSRSSLELDWINWLWTGNIMTSCLTKLIITIVNKVEAERNYKDVCIEIYIIYVLKTITWKNAMRIWSLSGGCILCWNQTKKINDYEQIYWMICLNNRFVVLHCFLFLSFSGRIGITTDITWPEPKTDSEEDKIASELALEFYVSTLKYFINNSNFIILKDI